MMEVFHRDKSGQFENVKIECRGNETNGWYGVGKVEDEVVVEFKTRAEKESTAFFVTALFMFLKRKLSVRQLRSAWDKALDMRTENR